MAKEYSIEVCKKLEHHFHAMQLHRPMRISRYDAGDELTYNVTGLGRAQAAQVRLVVEKFVGGGFAGQVYRVKVLAVEGEPVDGIEAGRIYAVKILVPPSGFSRLFRDLLYRIGFQGPFQLQVNPAAARAGALWQKFIRRAAKLRFGDERAVVDIYGTFVDEKLGSCGEMSEWIDGRTWLLEVDDRLDLLKRRRRGREVDLQHLGSLEYRAKKKFMADFVRLLHDVGAYEFARQYEWSTCKSQPNCLKRQGTQDDPAGGLTAVDFRAGLALLPFLPMSPGDFKLILKGLARGSLVQFDRGSLAKLNRFVEANAESFADMRGMLDELKEAERVYRDSVPDVTHNHFRLFCSGRLWSTMLTGAVTGWKVRNLIDDRRREKLHGSRILTFLFCIVGMIPFLGKLILRLWGSSDWRRHYGAMLTSGGYLRRAIRGWIAEKVVKWHRAGRVGRMRAFALAESAWRFLPHLPLAILPAGLHRFLTDGGFRKEKLAFLFVRPFRLYFNRELREQWLRDMVAEGRKKHMLSDGDAELIVSQINEPYIQRYLISLVVHLMTLPVTQVVSVICAVVYVLMHPEMPRAQAWGIGFGIIALFQVVPISPGSFCRGLWAVGIAIYDRSFKDYNIAVFLSFFKYIGYLAFPIQMTYHYPALARFMAGHWATEAVHIVPVFGERGALLEHWAFCLFYNWPLTIRRRMRRRAEVRAALKPRYWHVGVCAIAAAAGFGLAELVYLDKIGELPGKLGIWWLAITIPPACGAAVTLGCKGAALARRIAAAALCGVLVGVLYTTATLLVGHYKAVAVDHILSRYVGRMFVFSILSAIGAVIAELRLPEPSQKI